MELLPTLSIILIIGLIFSLRSIMKARDLVQKKLNETSKELEETKLSLEKFKPITNLESKINELENNLAMTEANLEDATERWEKLNYESDVKELNYYHPKFFFEDSLQYLEALDLIREAQKELIRNHKVIVNRTNSNKKLENTSKSIAKIIISAFNLESNYLIEAVTYNNFEKSKEKLNNLHEKLNKELSAYNAEITLQYLKLKHQEMALAYDYREAEKRAKDEQAELKEQMKEEEKARAEAEKAREKAIKEQEQYESALSEARKEMENKSDEEKAEYERKILELQAKLDEATAERERATSMAQITKEGHVYIISNIGSFGEKVFKIGMTRRKEPMDRVKELGDASVPFPFDVHAMVRTKNAPELEKSLHRYFESQRLNKVNNRKEFFRATIDEISQACLEMGHSIQLSKLAEAREYRETLNLESETEAA